MQTKEAQFALLLGKPTLTAKDYGQAEEVICHMVLAALKPSPNLSEKR